MSILYLNILCNVLDGKKISTTKCAYDNMQANAILNYAIKNMFYYQNHVCNVIIKYMFYLFQSK
jgi:hypothetical protein